MNNNHCDFRDDSASGIAMRKDRTFMTRTRLAACLSFLAAAVLLSPARAEDPSTSKARVVLVAVSQYKDAKIKARKYAEEDARELYKVFTDKKFLRADP